MGWFILKHIFSTIFTFITIGRLSHLEKDLESLFFDNIFRSCSANSIAASDPAVLRK